MFEHTLNQSNVEEGQNVHMETHHQPSNSKFSNIVMTNA
jgi:hypothetical protein